MKFVVLSAIILLSKYIFRFHEMLKNIRSSYCSHISDAHLMINIKNTLAHIIFDPHNCRRNIHSPVLISVGRYDHYNSML